MVPGFRRRIPGFRRRIQRDVGRIDGIMYTGIRSNGLVGVEEKEQGR